MRFMKYPFIQAVTISLFIGLIGLLNYTPIMVLSPFTLDRVMSGDILSVRYNDNYHQIKLAGIKVPKRKQNCFDSEDREYPCGAVSTEHLKHLVKWWDNAREINCAIADKDEHGRFIGICYVPDQDESINERMVRDGWAIASYTDNSFSAQEQYAERHKRGIWQGFFSLHKRLSEHDERYKQDIWEEVVDINYANDILHAERHTPDDVWQDVIERLPKHQKQSIEEDQKNGMNMKKEKLQIGFMG